MVCELAAQTQQPRLSPEMEAILELARWAPSGDNTQPWRFRLLGKYKVEVIYQHSESLGVFNLDHFAGHLAMGALLESLNIAASTYGWKTKIYQQPKSNIIKFIPNNLPPSALLPYLKSRVTQRRALSLNQLSVDKKRILEESVGKSYNLIWIEDWPDKIRLAKLLGLTDKIRLSIPEAYQVHCETVAWNTKFSEDRIPDAAIAASPPLLRVMHWAMVSWKRVDILNRYLLGHLLPRLEMDIIPALFCGAHCLLVANQPIRNEHEQDGLDAGRAMQRLWLTATSIGLQAQPEMAPVIFSRYVNQNRNFTENTKELFQAKLLRKQFVHFFGNNNWCQAAFMMRFGEGKTPAARSMRKPLADLIETTNYKNK